MCKRIAAVLTLVAVLGCASLAQATVIGCWQLNEKTPGQQTTGVAAELIDSAGSHNGKAVGDPLPYYATGTPTTAGPATSAIALTSVAATDYLEVPNSADFNLNLGSPNDYTIEALVKSNAAPSEAKSPAIFTKRATTGMGYSFRTLLGTGQLSLYVEGSGLNFLYPSDVHGNTNVLDGNWHHVAVAVHSDATASLTSATFYVDKVLDGSMTFQGHVYQGADWANENITNTAAERIGDFIGRPEDQWVGSIDAVAFSTGLLGPSNFVLPAIGVPEPGTAMLLFVGVLGLLAYAWKKRK
jgi:hypothetical protein